MSQATSKTIGQWTRGQLKRFVEKYAPAGGGGGGSGDITAVTAGNGISGGASSGAATVQLDVSDSRLTTETTVQTGDLMAFSDENVSDDPTKNITVDNLITKTPALLTEASVADGDYIVFLDGNATGDAKKESLADLATLMAGTVTTTGIAAASSVLKLDIQNMTASTTVTDADLVVVDDGADGTLRKMTRAHFIESAALDSINIMGGNINTAIIGGITPAAGTFTALIANDSLVVNANASIVGDTAGEIQLNVKGHGSQSTSILNIELDDGTDKLTVSDTGVTTAASLVATTADINGGTIDAVTIGTNSACTRLVVDDVDVNGKVITMTGSTNDIATITVGTNGTLDISTTDTASAAANMTLTADGAFEAIGTTITLDSGGAINLEPAADSAILLDGTISVDAGVVLGATSISSTAFVGDLTGDASGTAATVTGAAQTAVTSLGTLTALQVDNINIDGNTISSTAGTDLNITPLDGQQIVLDGTIVIDAGVMSGATSISSTTFVGDSLTVDDVVVDGKVITMTGSTNDTAVFTVGTNGTLSVVTTDTTAAAANIQITADGTAELAGTTVTLDSGGDVNIESDALNIGNDGDTDVVATFKGNTSDGVLTWMEDEDEFRFSDSVRGKLLHYTYHSYNRNSGVSKHYIPINSTVETPDPMEEYQTWVAAHDGKLVKVLINTRGYNAPPVAYGGSVEVGLHIDKDGTAATTSTVTIASDTSVSFPFSSSNTFSAGALLSVSVTPSTVMGDVNVVCVWEYDTTT
jgi:hypothetical protein